MSVSSAVTMTAKSSDSPLMSLLGADRQPEAMPHGQSVPIPKGQRLAVAVLVAVAYWLYSWVRIRGAGPYALGYDYTLHWWAGDALRRGYSPYAVINAWTWVYPFCSGYLYWLPTAIILEPLSRLDMQTAMPVFAALSMGIFAYALTRDGWWRLPFLLSWPAIFGGRGGVVTPLVVAAMLVPSLGWLAPMKYTMAVAGFAYNLSWRYVALAGGVVLASVVAYPWWPLAWLHELHDVAGNYYAIPVAGFGAVCLLALLRWRRPEARLLAIMACLPQTMMFYDQLPLLLVARSYRESLWMCVLSYAPLAVLPLVHGVVSMSREQLLIWNAPIIVACYYIPCVVLVLRRPNVAPNVAPR